MDELLKRLSGKLVDVICSNGTVIRGEVGELRDGILHMNGEDGRIGYVAVEKISAVWETKDNGTKPGFVG